MGTRTSHPVGTFCWVDLQTTDPEAAKRFYSELFGWTYDELPGGEGGTYAMALVGGEEAAAIAPMPPGAQFPPHWNSYVAVESADAAASRAREVGGSVAMEPFDVFDAGRMAVIADPTGAFVLAWEPRNHAGAHRVNDHGCFIWNELGTNDPVTAARFYGDLFGWTYEERDMGPMGTYRVILNGGRQNGGIRPQSEQEAGVPPNWLVYFSVEDVDATVSTAGEIGGRVLAPPMDLPMGSRIAVLADPQGAAFALYAGDVDE
jgi:predicted enzyme related to lactoylglutathione lyase